jgi:hypothetical protein
VASLSARARRAASMRLAPPSLLIAIQSDLPAKLLGDISQRCDDRALQNDYWWRCGKDQEQCSRA